MIQKRTEATIQQEIIVWFRNKYCLAFMDTPCVIFSVPNETAAGYLEMRKLKLTGLFSGVSDLIVVMPNRLLFVEVKTPVGRQSVKQKYFEKLVTNLGFNYHLVRSLEDFKQLM